MDQKILDRVNHEIYKKFPDLEGAKPRITKSSVPKSRSDRDSVRYTLTYRRSVKISQTKTIPLVVRVVCSEDGKIQKLSSSK